MILKNIPKIELHCHLDGSVRAETVLEIAKAEHIELERYELEEIKEKLSVSDQCTDLMAYLSCFDIPMAVMQSKESLRRVAYELILDCETDGVKYIEVRFAPFQHMSKGLTFNEVIESVLLGLKQGEDKTGVMSGLIVCVMRHDTPERSVELVKMAKAYLQKGIVAIDLAGNEHDFPPEIHKNAFILAKEYGFDITVHAGETGIAENIVKSIECLKAERIGHGVFAYKSEAVVAYILDHQIPLEMCPSSNLQTMAVSSIDHHPIRSYLDMGIKVTVSTDNRTVSNTTMTQEYELLATHLNFTEKDFLKIYSNSIDVAFCDDGVKERLKKHIK